ncbi:MAG: hypothetical protein KAJ98_03995 [Spirochaetaceae bacterium]|nr:hypothetical protein [Spirochaetaceae bacterium]
MKKVILTALLLIIISGFAFSQSHLLLVSGGYFQQKNSYEFKSNGIPGGLPVEDFSDIIRSFGIGVTQYFGKAEKVGIYSSTHLLIPIDLVRKDSTTPDGRTLAIQDFRFGIDAINGFGVNIQPGRVGFLLGGGIHLSYNLFWTYPESNESRFNLFNIGLGGGGHVYFMINEDINIHLGTVWWYDFFELRYSSGNSISDNFYYNGGWGYQVSIGVGFKLASKPRHGMM